MARVIQRAQPVSILRRAITSPAITSPTPMSNIGTPYRLPTVIAHALSLGSYAAVAASTSQMTRVSTPKPATTRPARTSRDPYREQYAARPTTPASSVRCCRAKNTSAAMCQPALNG